MSEWISVNDRLPEDWQRVDILINSQRRITDVAFDRNKFFAFPPTCKEPWTEINNNVTHWMPEPELPKP